MSSYQLWFLDRMPALMAIPNMGFYLMQQAEGNILSKVRTKPYNLAVLSTNPSTAAGERTRTSAGAVRETMWMLEAQ